MSVFFTSDTHWFHANIIGFSNRPFDDLSWMHSEMVRMWNAKVGPQDEVFHLGDVSFGNTADTLLLLNRLNGRMRYVPGNHDSKPQRLLREGRDDVVLPPLYERTFQSGNVGTQKVVMCHFPLLTWNKAAHGSWMLHGHSHGSMDERNKTTRRLDVGVDGIAQYAPLSLEEVAAIMSTREYEIVDSHGMRTKSEED
jgi:calcineurin-like phosphoesterase family protein